MKNARLFRASICFVGTLSLNARALAENVSMDLASETKLQQQIQLERVSESPSASLAQVLPALQYLGTENSPRCVEVSLQKNSEAFVTSFAANGEPCRLYNLAFPNASWLNRLHSGAIPVQVLSPESVSQWFENAESLETNIESFQTQFNVSELPNTWYGQLRFRHNTENMAPQLEFNLSEIELDAPLVFQKEEAEGILRLAKLAGYSSAPMENLVNRPESILESISLQWNPRSKAFDIFTNLQALPFGKPVVLVDYNLQYKHAAEKLIRQALLRSLRYAVSFLPNPTTRKLLTIALEDSFEFLEIEYAYQMNRLESVLENNIAGRAHTNIHSEHLTKALNILAAQRSPLVQQYILARVLKQKFNLNELYKVGAQVRYQEAKTRESTRLRLHSQLVKKKSCQTQVVENFFAICARENGSRELYSLLSESKILAWNLGATRIHNFNARYKTLATRNAAWMLSSAVRMAPLPIPGFLSGQLVAIAKNVATEGLTEDARLLGALETTVGQAPDTSLLSTLIPYFYKQNLVPFAPKSLDMENNIIRANLTSLQKRIPLL